MEEKNVENPTKNIKPSSKTVTYPLIRPVISTNDQSIVSKSISKDLPTFGTPGTFAGFRVHDQNFTQLRQFPCPYQLGRREHYHGLRLKTLESTGTTTLSEINGDNTININSTGGGGGGGGICDDTLVTSVTTTDATSTLLGSYATSDNTIVAVNCVILGANETDDQANTYFLKALFKNTGGGVMEIVDEDILNFIQDDGISATIMASGANIEFNVMGLAGKTFDWGLRACFYIQPY